jgi:hypothetical protein
VNTFNEWTTNLKRSPNDIDKKILAIQNLVGTLHSDMRRSEKLLSWPQAKRFVDGRNAAFKANNPDKPEPYKLLEFQDYDGDTVPDTIIGRNNKIYSYNGYRPKETDHPLRQAYFMNHPDQRYKRKALTEIQYNEDDMHTPEAWNLDEYQRYLSAIPEGEYKTVDRLRSNRVAEKHRSVFQVLVMLVSKTIQEIKGFLKASGVDFVNDSSANGVSAMTAIASELNTLMFLEPAFQTFNEHTTGNVMDLNRWQSKVKGVTPSKAERTAIKKIIDNIFASRTSPANVAAFKQEVEIVTIEMFKNLNPDYAETIDAQLARNAV